MTRSSVKPRPATAGRSSRAPLVCVRAAVIGIVVGFPAARLKGFFLAIATLALGELIVTIIRLDDKVWSGLKTNGGTGKQVPIFRLFGAGQSQRLLSWPWRADHHLRWRT